MSWIKMSDETPPKGKVVVVKGDGVRRAIYRPETATFDDCDSYSMVFTVTEWKNE